MADRGIIFSAPMVRALLDGRKTQTRRLFKARHGLGEPVNLRDHGVGNYSGRNNDPASWGSERIEQAEAGEPCGDHFPCPEGYIQWRTWAAPMSKTHQQRQCPDCGLYAIWEPKPAALKAKEQNDGD